MAIKSLRPYAAMGTYIERDRPPRRCLTICWLSRLWTVKLWQ